MNDKLKAVKDKIAAKEAAKAVAKATQKAEYAALKNANDRIAYIAKAIGLTD